MPSARTHQQSNASKHSRWPSSAGLCPATHLEASGPLGGDARWRGDAMPTGSARCRVQTRRPRANRREQIMHKADLKTEVRRLNEKDSDKSKDVRTLKFPCSRPRTKSQVQVSLIEITLVAYRVRTDRREACVSLSPLCPRVECDVC